MKDINKLNLITFNTSFPKNFEENCERAYELYLKVWAQTFAELGVDKKIYSDSFLDCELVGCFDSERSCIGFVLMKSFDISRKSMREHSYFDPYPSDIIKKVISLDHKNIISFHHLTVNSEWRRSESSYSISDIVVGAAISLFLKSKSSAVICFTRNDRRVNELFYRFGGAPIVENIMTYNVLVDYAILEKSKVQSHPSYQINKLVSELISENEFQNEINRRVA